jgi:hypothetical protein
MINWINSWTIVLLFITTSNIHSQKAAYFESLVTTLHDALVNKDSVKLNELLHPDLSYGHSNGWVEKKHELISNNISQYLIYENITMDSLSLNYSGKFAIIRFQAVHNVIVKEKKMSLLLHVCQVWIKHKGKWKLLARQSAKLS